MSGRTALILAAALAIGLPIASPGQTTPPQPPSIRWEVEPSGTTSAVSVVGLSPEALASLGKPDRSPDAFTIRLATDGPKPADRPAMLGSYRVEGDAFRFTPRYTLDKGRTYVATFRPSKVPGLGGPDLESSRLIPRPKRPSTVVSAVAPSADRLPENLLKFYLYFSSPMSRGEVYDRVRLVRDDGRVVDRPFLHLEEELWDPTGTRLTVLIDPGRIKKGLRPRELFGPVLEAGRSYTLVIDAAWPDAEGDPLGAEVRKTFRAGPADETQPDPRTWTFDRPSPSTRAPLTLTFPEPIDRALLESALTLVDPKGEAVEGRLSIEANETRWRFTPDAPWTSGDYQLAVDVDLEDLAGNSIGRPFEVDATRETPARPDANLIRLPIAIGPKSP